jgi:hypothetical protein
MVPEIAEKIDNVPVGDFTDLHIFQEFYKDTKVDLIELDGFRGISSCFVIQAKSFQGLRQFHGTSIKIS